jgi:hypothetical protein
MTAGEIVQFYAPFVGLMALAFWMGVLSQRVRQLEKGGDGTASLAADVAEMKSDVRHIGKSVDELKGKLEWATEVPPLRPSRPRASK